MPIQKFLSKGRIEAVFWILGGIVLIGFVLYYDRSRKLHLKHASDVFHFILSGVTALIGLRISRLVFVRFSNKSLIHLLISLSAVAVVGGGFEIAQSFFGGDPSWGDFVRDVEGGTFALLLLLGLDKRKAFSRTQRGLLILSAAIIAALALYPGVAKSVVFYRQYRTFPLLAGFEEPWQPDLFTTDGGAILVRERPPGGFSKAQGDWVGKVVFKAGNGSPSISLPSVDGNWSAFNEFKVDLYLKEKHPIEIILGIKDSWPDKSHLVQFYRVLSITPGENTINIPVRDIRPTTGNRQMNVADIDYLYFIRKRPTADVILYLDNIRLER